MDPRKLKGVADWPKPKNPMDICKFLGFTGYYCYFVSNYSKIAQPLLDLTGKHVQWDWGKAQQKSIQGTENLNVLKPSTDSTRL
jgi:hypothetical protein